MENQTNKNPPSALGDDTPLPAHEPGQVFGPSQSAPPASPHSPVPPPSDGPIQADRPAAVAGLAPQNGIMANGQMISFNEQQTQQPKKRFHPSKKLLIPLVAISVLLGGSAAAYFGYFVPNKPDNVLAKAVENSLAAHQLTITGLLDATSSGVSGRVDYKAKIDADSHSTDVTLNTTISGVQFPIEILTDNGNFYFKVGDLSTIEGLINGFAGGSSDIGQIKQIENKINTTISGQWIEVDNTLIKEAKLGCLANYPASLSQSDIKSLQNSYKKAMFATVSNHSPDTVNGIKSVKYDVQINDNKLAGMALGGVGAVSSLNSCLNSIDKTASINLNSLKDGKTHTVSLWVDPAAKKINKFATAYTDASSGDQTALSGTFDYGSVNIQEPAKSEPLLGLLSELGMGSLITDTISSYNGVQQQAKDTERKTDINALQSQLEAYFADKGSYPTLSDLNNPAWRTANLNGADTAAFQDPDGSTVKLGASPAAHIYSYQASPAGCNNTSIQCQHYTLTATLSTGGTYTKQSLN